MIEVKDGPRILRFEGKEIGHSSSERPGAGRWIEFTLYKTDGGQYVLSRIGASDVYHAPDCRFVRRGSIEPVPRSALSESAIPCHQVHKVTDPCFPDQDNFPLVCPEEDKTWARAFRRPEDVMKGLLKPDQNGGDLYLTAVARRLLESAAKKDSAIAGIYEVQTVL